MLLLNGPGQDRSAWWPVAARLADDHTVAVLDLPPGIGAGPLADDLARTAAGLGTRAPVLVGHAAGAVVASVFAARFVTHAVVGVEQRLDAPDADREALREITEGRPRIRCEHLSVFARPPGPGYTAWLRERIPKSRCAVYACAGPHPHLRQASRFAQDIRAIAG